jgi:hypothetical protein
MQLTENQLQKYSKIIFSFCILLLMFPILSNTWMVTGDGPCHLYNAKILKDLFWGQNLDFYQSFYTLDLSLTPNLWDHLLFAAFQTILSPSMSEKLFFILYILTFAFGARYICEKMQPNSIWAAVTVLLFTFHHLLMKGFLNYSWSLAGAFWVIGYFLGHWDKLSDWKTGLKLCLLLLINYFMHPIGFVFAMVGIVFSIIIILASHLMKSDAKDIIVEFITKLRPLLLIVLPAVLLYINFFTKASFSKSLDWGSLVKINSLTTYVEEELIYSFTIGKMCILILLLGIPYRIYKGPTIHKGDGILLLGLFFVFLFHANLIDDGMIGGDRLKFLPHLCLMFWLTTLRIIPVVKMVISSVAVLFLILLSIERYPAYADASAWVDDYMECEKYIEPNTKVLTLNYEYNGTRPDGLTIATMNWAFMHGTSYLGAMKPLILSDNYQAHMSWFPLNWRDQRFSFYNSTGIDGITFENRPPRADINGYAAKSGKNPIEYVLIIGQKDVDKLHQHGLEITKSLESYELVCTSKSKKSQLYKIK